MILLITASRAFAHIELDFPVERTPDNSDDQKDGPCGGAGSVRSANVTTYLPGQTITVQWRETIDHNGHYRLAFDADGQDFVNPPDEVNNSGPFDTNGNMIVDLIPDVGGAIPSGGRLYQQSFTLPDVECTTCTLQLIQLMSDNPGFDPLTDLYYQCADIELRRDSSPTPDAAPLLPDARVSQPDGQVAPNPGTSEIAGGCRSIHLPGIWLAALGLLLYRRSSPRAA